MCSNSTLREQMILCLFAGMTMLSVNSAWAQEELGQAGSIADSNAESDESKRAFLVESMIHDLGEQIARALNDEETRLWLHRELQSSPWVEKRIPINRLLEENLETREMLLHPEKMRWSWDRMRLFLPDLELYFPIAQQREAWDGRTTPGLIVPLIERGGYSLCGKNGSSIEIDDSFEASFPILRLGASEIDYDDPESAVEGGLRTGSYLRQRADSPLKAPGLPLGGGFATRGISTQQYTYLTYLKVLADREGLFGGSMEIEIFGSINGTNQDCVRFTGLEEDDVLFLTSETYRIATAVPTGSTKIEVHVYEDDKDACQIHRRDDDMGSVLIPSIDYGEIISTLNPNQAEVSVEAAQAPCGNGLCDGSETCSSCSSDCGPCPCGNSICASNESCLTCPGDCGSCCDNDGVCEVDEFFEGGCADCSCSPGPCIIGSEACGSGLCVDGFCICV